MCVVLAEEMCIAYLLFVLRVAVMMINCIDSLDAAESLLC